MKLFTRIGRAATKKEIHYLFIHLFPLDDLEVDPPPPPPDVAQNDLMMRLGLLLGDRMPNTPPSSNSSLVATPSGNQTEDTFTSVSSLNSESHDQPHDQSHDTIENSPMSTLTG